MVPQSWLSDTAEKHYVVPKTLPQDITRANIERSISLLSEGIDISECDFAKAHVVQKQQEVKTTAADASRARSHFYRHTWESDPRPAAIGYSTFQHINIG